MSAFLMSLLGGGVGVAIVTGIFMLVGKRIDRKAQKEDRAEAKEEARLRDTHAEVKVLQKQIETVILALQMLLGATIRSKCEEYIMHESVSSDELSELMRYHEVYHNGLNGNGFYDSLMKRVKRLPIKNG